MDITALFNLSYGLYVVSSKDGDRDVGCVINSVMQVSATPGTIAISVNKDNFTNPSILKSGKFAISILSENAKSELIGSFGFSSSKDRNKFESVKSRAVENELTVLDEGSCGYVVCNVISQLDCYTHTIIVGDIIDAQNISKEIPMTYAYYHKVIKGKTPKNSPSYVSEEETEKGYKCSVCGYHYDGTKEEFESLPDTYRCPICSAEKSKFILVE